LGFWFEFGWWDHLDEKRVVFAIGLWGQNVRQTGLDQVLKTVYTWQDRGVTTDLKGLMVKWFPIGSRKQLRVP